VGAAGKPFPAIEEPQHADRHERIVANLVVLSVERIRDPY